MFNGYSFVTCYTAIMIENIQERDVIMRDRSVVSNFFNFSFQGQ